MIVNGLKDKENKMKTFLIYLLVMAAYTLVIILAQQLVDDRLWIKWLFFIPVAMAYVGGGEAQRNYQKIKEK